MTSCSADRPGPRISPRRRLGYEAVRRLRRAHARQEGPDFARELLGLLGEVGGGGEHHAGGVAGLVGGRADAADIGGDFLGGLRRLRDAAGDLGGGGALLLDRGADRGGDRG